jgi:hypothetical protein
MSHTYLAPINVPGLVAGVVVGASVLITGVVLLAFFLRRRRRGLYVAITEPNYVHVAFQGDQQLQYKINVSDDFK